VWIGNVRVFDAGSGSEYYLGSDATILDDDGIENFFAAFGAIQTRGNL
jgi:hypothetical protein